MKFIHVDYTIFHGDKNQNKLHGSLFKEVHDKSLYEMMEDQLDESKRDESIDGNKPFIVKNNTQIYTDDEAKILFPKSYKRITKKHLEMLEKLKEDYESDNNDNNDNNNN